MLSAKPLLRRTCGLLFVNLMDNYEWALGYEKRFGMVHGI